MIGAFIEWSRETKRGHPGWIIDGSGCHIWVGARNPDGYGVVCVGGRMNRVHRVRYEREVGPIPPGLVLDHYVCNNGPGGCCNPRHCRPASSRENTLRGDGISSANAAKTHCPKGHILSGDNIVGYYLLRRGERCCRICHNKRTAERKRRNRAKQKTDLYGPIQHAGSSE